jgi:hypothetical protein
MPEGVRHLVIKSLHQNNIQNDTSDISNNFDAPNGMSKLILNSLLCLDFEICRDALDFEVDLTNTRMLPGVSVVELGEK